MTAVSHDRFGEACEAAEGPRLAAVPSPDLRGDSLPRRLVDIVVAAAALVLMSPVLLIVAIAVKLDSAGPALYSQQRVGRLGRTFSMQKFRSMVANADKMGPLVTGRRDPRITRLGAFLRSTKLDELPQLINVLKGDMTLIGPRPEVPRYFPSYSERELQLLIARPGLTGPGQLFFTDKEAAELDDSDDPEAYYVSQQLHPKLAVDIAYLCHRSLWLDVKIVLGTVALVFWRADSRVLRDTLQSP